MPSPERFNWLHLTDLHFGQTGQRPLWSNVRDAFFKDLRRLHERVGPWHAVLFTGDFVQSGKPEDFAALESQVLTPLWEELRALGSGEAVLLAVPGNHDLVRPEKKRAAVRMLLTTPFAELEDDFWAHDSDYLPVINAAFANYQTWWSRTPFRRSAKITTGLLPGDFSTSLSVGSRRFGIVGLNTTFLQLEGGDLQGRLAWDVRQIEAVCNGDAAGWCKEHDICLLLTHQGPDWLDRNSREDIYPEINPAGRFAVHLFGHMHETVLRATSSGGGKPLRQWQGRSLFGLESYGEPLSKERRHGYGAGIVEFGAQKTTIRFWPLLGVKDGNGWRFVRDEESCVLTDDGGTEPEPIANTQRTRATRSKPKPSSKTAPSTAPSEVLLATYTKAARALWDIIDLAGLPEDDRHLAMQRFVLRDLYLPIRITVEERLKEEAFAALEAKRERSRLASAGRVATERAKASERVSLGSWLQGVLLSRREDGKLVSSAGPRLVILGDPGGGKTTLLRWLATACLLRREGDPDFARLPDADSLPAVDWLPILIRCRELDKARVDQSALEDLLRQTLAKMELPGGALEALIALLRGRLETGDAILLVDGLDEITDPGLRAAFCGRLEAVAKRFPAAPILATSRIVGYREMRRRLGEGFAHGTLAELAPEEKDEFIRRWCEITISDPGRRESEAEKLRRGIHGTDRIERLTTNPMLLTTMALVQRKVGKLPTRRHKLYWEAVGVLLNWRGEVEDPMDPDEALPQLEYLAYAMCDRGVQRLRRDEVLTLLEWVRRDYPNIRPVQRQTPEAFLAQLERRTGLLVEVGEVTHSGKPTPVYEFRHLTFQEYLAALAILEGRFPGHRQGSTLADRVSPLAGRIATGGSDSELLVTENWREAIRLCVASCNDDDVQPLLEAILEPNQPEETRPRAILAVLCLADEPNVSQEMAEKICRYFAEQVSRRDGLGMSRTGLDVAAMETAISVWAEPLRGALVREFRQREPESRANPGGLAAMIAVSSMPGSEAKSEEWLAQQSAGLVSTSKTEATGAALAIMEAAYEGRALMTEGLVQRLMVLIGQDPASSHAAAWALWWLAGGATGRKGIWKPAAHELTSFLPYISNVESDPQALRLLIEIVRIGRFHAAVSACRTQIHSVHAPVRASAARALGQIRDPATVATLLGAMHDEAEEVRRDALGGLVEIDQDEIDSKLVSTYWDADWFYLDPQKPIPTERIREAAQKLALSEKEIRQRYEKLAKKYGLRLEWLSAQT